MTDQSQFDGNVTPPGRPGKGGLIAALVLGLILGAGLMLLWGIYGSAPLSQPEPGVAANAPNETAQAIKDLQTTEQKIVETTEQKIVGQLQSVQQTLASEQAETKRLSDQITTLNGKLDALQQSFAAQQQSSPAPSPPPPAPAKRRR
jgi:peptidoglycan hydrolase CwlO-like protein